MSTDTEYRFPTLHAPYGGNTRIPIYPRSSIFQTVKEDLAMPQIEEVMSRPSWDFEEANLRLFREKRDRLNAEAAAAMHAAAEKPPAKKAAAKRPAAKKASPAKRAPAKKTVSKRVK